MSKLSDVFPQGEVVTWRVKSDPKVRKFVHDTIVHSIVTRNLSARSNECIRSGPTGESKSERRYKEMVARRNYRAEEKRVRAELKEKGKK